MLSRTRKEVIFDSLYVNSTVYGGALFLAWLNQTVLLLSFSHIYLLVFWEDAMNLHFQDLDSPQYAMKNFFEDQLLDDDFGHTTYLASCKSLWWHQHFCAAEHVHLFPKKQFYSSFVCLGKKLLWNVQHLK